MACVKAVGAEGEGGIEFLAGGPPAVMLAGNERALKIAGQAVRPVGRLEEQRGAALARLMLHPAVVVDVAEQEVAALVPPQRPLGRALRPAKPVGQVLDRPRWRQNLFKLRGQLLDSRARLRPPHGKPSD